MSEEKKQNSTTVKAEDDKKQAKDKAQEKNINTKTDKKEGEVLKKDKSSDKVEKEKESTKKKVKKQQNQKKIISPLDVKPGMIVKIWQKIKETTPKGETKERLQYFEGTVLARKGRNEPGATVTVRKTSNGVGVEKIFPLALPTIDKIELLQKVKTRRSKLYFLRRGYKKRLKKESID